MRVTRSIVSRNGTDTCADALVPAEGRRRCPDPYPARVSLRSLLARATRALTPHARRPAAIPPTAPTTDYPVAERGLPNLRYAPRRDGRPDPGEVVWAWVPFEEDASRGKDRPVLVIGSEDGRLVGLMLTSRDHDRDAAQEARWGRYWMDVGTGAWDRQGRPSEVRLDRVLSLPVDGVRREGGALPAARFAEVATALRDVHGR